jgi:DNA-binding MarR family transcriptional regulator
MSGVGNDLARLRDVAALLRRVSAWRASANLTAHQSEVLIHVLDSGAISAAELSRRVGISTASMSRLLDQVQAAGWVVRFPDPRDARSAVVQPSKKLATELTGLVGDVPTVANDTIPMSRTAG